MEQQQQPTNNSTNEEEKDPIFLDASDDFPFYDSLDSLQSSSFTDSAQAQPQAQGLRRRRSHKTPLSDDLKPQPSTLASERFEPATSQPQPQTKQQQQQQQNETSTVTNVPPTTTLSSDGFEPATSQPQTKQQQAQNETSTVTLDESVPTTTVTTTLPRCQDDNNINDSNGGTQLVCVAEFVLKAIAYQFNLLITIITFPFWVLKYTCKYAFNPFFVLSLGKSFLIGKLNKVYDTLRPYVNEWLNEHKPPWFDFALRCTWGLLWSIYVCILLITLLISSFVIGGLLMRYYVVEEPYNLKQGLNFDYTSSKPVAYVPVEGKVDDEVVSVGGVLRAIPPKHKLQTTVTMVLPESDYNRNLGIFQVKVEFISENGKSLGTFRHPCMLEFKSQPLRILLTFFKIVPLVAGYLSETQTVKLTFRGYTEGVVPTACLKITMEQRAEFRPSAGIPEVYDAFVHVESELPLFRRILWYWRRTIFVWLSMMVFSVELLFALICCTPAMFPRTRPRSNVTRNNPALTT